MKYISVVCLFICCLINNSVSAQTQKKEASKKLYDTIAHMNSLMFDAFNKHDVQKLGSLFSEDLEFYHDKGGLADFKTTMQNFRKLFEQNKITGLRRDLVNGSLKVYPIADHGAVEVCLHRFCHKENEKDECGTFKNVMIWRRTDKGWQVTRVISYDH